MTVTTTDSSSNVNSGMLANGQSKNTKTMASKIKTTPINKGSLNSNKSSHIGQSVSDNLLSCKICSRNFASDRISLHEQICSKTAQKKRKQFDASMSRVKGTELEQFVTKKPIGSKKVKEVKPTKPNGTKSSWRRKHEDFINAIRSAKQMQAHLAAGGKLSDLPPPPPSDTSDYIQCPHCSRKFNQGAAERHIPKCETMLHNKTPAIRSKITPNNKSRRS